MEPKKCPICGELPRVWFAITDTEGLKRGTNEFIVGCRMTCAGCGHVDTRQYGTYFIAPDGQIHPVGALVECVTETYNSAIEKLAEQIRRTAEETRNFTIDKITKEETPCTNSK